MYARVTFIMKLIFTHEMSHSIALFPSSLRAVSGGPQLPRLGDSLCTASQLPWSGRKVHWHHQHG